MTVFAIEPRTLHERSVSASRHGLCRLAIVLLMCLATAIANALAQEANPLEPPDRSSPRAALKTFLDSGDALVKFAVDEYAPSPSHAKFLELIEMSATPRGSFDLSELPPAQRLKASRAATLFVFGTLSRIELPPFDQIPDAGHLPKPAPDGTVRWVIPGTEIALVQVQKGPRSGEFLFSAETVARAEEFYRKVRHLPYVRYVPLTDVERFFSGAGGWMIPYRWIQAIPAPLRVEVFDQAVWKWIGLSLLLVAYVAFLRLASRVVRASRDRSPFMHALAQLALPAAVLAATPALMYMALVQLNLVDEVAVAVEVAGIAVIYLTGAWLVWRIVSAAAEAIITAPEIAPESIDAHLIRVSARLFGIIGCASLLALGASKLGIPIYGIVAGLGVGGLAIALAAQPTIENLIGGLNLFADKPIRVGDLCKYGDEIGTVEAIGIRSSRIRGLDRSLTSIPNSALAKMPIVNLTQRDRMLIRTVVGLRYETTPEQLRYVLVKLREMLVGHPRIDADSARARFVGFGASSLDIEVFAYATTRVWAEFLGIREDVLLRIMNIVEEGGTAIAFPSQTLYLGRDSDADEPRVEAAEAAVRAWREEGSLPFPDFSPEQARQLRGSVAFPPAGSIAATQSAKGRQAAPVSDSPAAGDAARRGSGQR